jgi:hypothetical protein
MNALSEFIQGRIPAVVVHLLHVGFRPAAIFSSAPGFSRSRQPGVPTVSGQKTTVVRREIDKE